jgi:AcrR family transcriptional regulator
MSAGDRLKDALTALQASSSGGLKRVTVSALCELAKVSRNSLYRYHPGVLDELRKCQRTVDQAAPARSRNAPHPQHEELVSLRNQIPKLIALIDHYFAAYREAQTMLTRREQELAELRSRMDLKPTRLVQRST